MKRFTGVHGWRCMPGCIKAAQRLTVALAWRHCPALLAARRTTRHVQACAELKTGTGVIE